MKFSALGVFTAIVVAALPFLPRFELLYGAIAPKAMLVVLSVDVILLAWAAVLYSRRDSSIKARNPLVIGIGLLLVVQSAAALLGVNPEKSFWGDIARSTGLLFLTHIALWTVALAHVLRSVDWSLIRRAVIVSAGLFALLALAGADGLGFKGSLLWIDFSSRGLTLGNETFAAMYLVLAAMLGAVEFVRTKSREWRVLIVLAIGLIAVSPYMLSSDLLTGRIGLADAVASPQLVLGLTRASSVVFILWLSFIGGWWVLTKIPHQKLRRVLKVAAVALTLLGAVVGSALHMLPGGIVQDALSDKTTVARYYVWESAIKATQERPLFGWGPENFDRAFETHFDTRLYTKEGRIEGWFDRAHNVVFDTAAATGLVGLSASAILLLAYALVVMRARSREHIGEGEALLLYSLPAVHLLQLQTAFDVVPSYALLAIAGGYVLSLDKEGIGAVRGRAVGAVVGLFAVLSLSYLLFYDLPRQSSLAASLSEGRAQQRFELLEFGLSSPSDFEAIHRSSNLFMESVYDEFKKNGATSETVQTARQYLAKYLAAYERYLAREPDHYRARMHYAYLLLLDAEWGGEGAVSALKLIEQSYALSPGNPTTYVLEVMARSYLGDFEGARRVQRELEEALPTIQLTKDVGAWLNEQAVIAPRHTFLQISNI